MADGSRYVLRIYNNGNKTAKVADTGRHDGGVQPADVATPRSLPAHTILCPASRRSRRSTPSCRSWAARASPLKYRAPCRHAAAGSPLSCCRAARQPASLRSSQVRACAGGQSALLAHAPAVQVWLPSHPHDNACAVLAAVAAWQRMHAVCRLQAVWQRPRRRLRSGGQRASCAPPWRPSRSTTRHPSRPTSRCGCAARPCMRACAARRACMRQDAPLLGTGASTACAQAIWCAQCVSPCCMRRC